MILEQRTHVLRPGAQTSMPRPIQRSAQSPPNCSPSSSRCSARCRRCGWSWVPRPTTRKVDKLSCVRFDSARYSVPCRLIGQTVTITTTVKMIMILEPVTGEVLAEHQLLPPGQSSIIKHHYGHARPDRPHRRPGQNPNRERFP
jgi:hypothetical protein